ncbi:universal stress protein [Limimaricola pyoseonensis]|uniref:Nucleotide-binding universal stress protein, UspA family n=1 Tax=Limimaricola pyoseonensis TaxID=521013 RepID=A0A1G7AGY2_9RHOB|nr:universal stress protein [Limimaricola pyoseonensis]SDE14194.1 Nucleotide-binding universal stress protein, UspA family [Limimaricola pyoseonensis]
MFKSIAIPIDLRHLDQMQRALAVGADLARHFGATITYLSATPSAPSSVARTPEQFAQKLQAFAAEQFPDGAVRTETHSFIVNDPTGDLDHALLEEIRTLDPDLVIMASHRPGVGDYFWPSHGGRIASHAPATVMLVREDVELSG